MKTKSLAIIAAVNLLLGLSARADLPTGGSTSGENQKGEKPELPEKPEVPGGQGGEVKGEKPDKPEQPDKPDKPDRPDKPDNSGKSAAMKEIVAEFQTKAAELRAQRADVAKQLKAATGEERTKLREQLQANREALVKLKEEFRDEVKALHDSLKDHSEKVDAEAKSNAKENLKAGRSRS